MGKDSERTPLLSKPSGCCGGKGGAPCCGGNGQSSSLTPTTGGASVPLKRSGNATGPSEGVWTIERRSSTSSLRSNRRLRVEDLLEDEEPLQSKCGASGGQCCEYDCGRKVAAAAR